MKSRTSLAPLSLALCSLLAGCKDDKPKNDNPPPPPPTVSSAKAGGCAGGGGALTDAISAPFFPRTVSGYCVDPQGEIKTYGEKGKLSKDEVCTTAFDGECEVYKRFGLKRVVSLHYIDGSGKGGTVEVNLSSFPVAGAYGMYTGRVVAGDPAEPSTPKVLAAGAAGAIGTGRAYVWRGEYLAELQYVNENESPEQLTKSSEAILTAVAREIGQRLPGPLTLPPAAQLLPTEHRIANGVLFYPSDAFGMSGIGPVAVGFYKEGERRYRVLSIVKDGAEEAKDVLKQLKAKPGSLPIANTGDEAVHVVLPMSSEEKGAAATKVEALFARKGNGVWGVADEEFALRSVPAADLAKTRVTKEEATAKMKTLLAIAVPPSSGPSGSAAPGGSAPAASGSAKPAPPAAAPGTSGSLSNGRQ